MRKPEFLFKALIARLMLLELPPHLAVNREHHTASPTRDGIGIFGTQCVRQLIQQGQSLPDGLRPRATPSRRLNKFHEYGADSYRIG